MDTVQNMRAFLAVCRRRSFVAAARDVGVAPSVLTKRVNQLEYRLNAKLLERTTRHVRPTELGERYRSIMQRIVRDYEELVSGIQRAPSALAGHIRIKVPARVTERVLAPVFVRFRRQHSAVTLDVVVQDESVNPLEGGFDIAIDVMNTSYDETEQETFLSYPSIVCAAPDYLARRGHPEHPTDLRQHDCLVFRASGSTWTFLGRNGPVAVNVAPCFITNDADLLLSVACGGCGVGKLSLLLARDALHAGRLVRVLSDYRTPELSLKAFVPRNRAHLARVRALLASIRKEVAAAVPPDLLSLDRACYPLESADYVSKRE